MKPIHFLTVILLAALFCTGGCDVFRKLAGRPASPEIEAARTAIEAERAARRADSLKNASLMEAKADSVSAVRLLDSLRVNVINSSVMGGDVPEYHIVVGSFRNMKNADALLEKVKASGYSASILRLGNGYSAVSACSSASIGDIADAYVRISGESFCPREAWILKNSNQTL